MEENQDDEVTFFFSKPDREKNDFRFFALDAITPIFESGFKIIDITIFARAYLCIAVYEMSETLLLF